MADAESISLEETNKIRISLGLKPLTDDKAPADTQEKTAEENYAKRREQERKEKETNAVAARIAKARNKLELNRRLVGATLGEAEDALDDTKAWIKRSKKKEKELAAKRQADLDNRDALDSGAYTEKDLEGLKVSHDFEDMEEGEARILTLKDSRILDNEEDELHNIDMAEVEKDKKRQELKTKRKDYTGYDDEEFSAGGDGLKRSVLAKYDEDLNGAPEKGFRLGSGIPQARQSTKAVHEQQAASVNKSLLSIDYAKNQEISDYAVEGERGFKKPKTKKKKSSRRMPADAELGGAEEDVKPDVVMQVDAPPVQTPRQRDLDANFIDDDDLQAALSRARRQKVKRTKISPEEIAARLAEERAEEEARLANQEAATTNGDSLMADDVKKEEEDDSALVFDDTTEFVRAIQYDPSAKPEPKKQEPISITIRTARSPSAAPGDEALAEMDVDAKQEDESGDENDDEVLNIIANAIAESEAQSTAVKNEQDDDELGTKAETFGSGLGGALNILRKQGIVGKASDDMNEREAIQKQNDKWLADYRHRLAERELERLRSKGSNKDQTQREYENRLREQQDAREQADFFKSYKPDVEIKYYDEFGREMDKKEAWKALSHRFHGKGSGKMKTEKRLKKIEDERKRAAMISGDTPTSMNEAFQKRQEKAGQAHMVLSVGNRGAVPQLEGFLDNATLSKAEKETKGKGKKKNAGTKTPVQLVDMTSFAMANSSLAPGIVPLPLSSNVSSAEGSPAPPAPAMMKPAFTRISSAAESTGPTPSGSGNASPMGGVGERTKVKIGFGLKRKALDEGAETPPSKR